MKKTRLTIKRIYFTILIFAHGFASSVRHTKNIVWAGKYDFVKWTQFI